MQIHCALQGEISVDRKKLSGVTKQLHSLYRSSQLLQKWKNCCSSDADVGVGGKDCKAAIVYARAVYTEFIKRQAGNKRERTISMTPLSLRLAQFTALQRKQRESERHWWLGDT